MANTETIDDKVRCPDAKSLFEAYRVFVLVEVTAKEEIPQVKSPTGPENAFNARVVQWTGILPERQEGEEKEEKGNRGNEPKKALRNEEEKIRTTVATGNVGKGGVGEEETTSKRNH